MRTASGKPESEAARRGRPTERDKQETGAELAGSGAWDGALVVDEPTLEIGDENSNWEPPRAWAK
jgi:hypothetical protein